MRLGWYVLEVWWILHGVPPGREHEADVQGILLKSFAVAAGVPRYEDADPGAEDPQVDLARRVTISHVRYQAQLLHRLSGEGLLCTTYNPQRHTYVIEGRPVQAVCGNVCVQRACARGDS